MSYAMNHLRRAAMERWGLKQIANPVGEQIRVDEARAHRRITTHEDDDVFEMIIPAAREWCEGYSGLALAPQTGELGGQHDTPEPCLLNPPITA